MGIFRRNRAGQHVLQRPMEREAQRRCAASPHEHSSEPINRRNGTPAGALTISPLSRRPCDAECRATNCLFWKTFLPRIARTRQGWGGGHGGIGRARGARPSWAKEALSPRVSTALGIHDNPRSLGDIEALLPIRSDPAELA